MLGMRHAVFRQLGKQRRFEHHRVLGAAIGKHRPVKGDVYVIEKFQDRIKNRYDYAKGWKAKTGGKVVGVFCCYTPEEVLYAAGTLPQRIFGEHEPQEVTAPYIYSGMFCPFCRNCLAQGLTGRMGYVDAVVMAQTCTHIRQSFDSWRWHLPVEFAHFISMPFKVEDPKALVFETKEYEVFVKAVEEWLGVKITDEKLSEAIDLYNESRQLLAQIYEMRKQNPPPIHGYEVLDVVEAGMIMDRKEYNELLKELVAWLPNRTDKPQVGSRLMIVGGENDQSELLKIIEDLGANIVTDDLCFGKRYWELETKKEGNLLGNLAARYLGKPSCPTKDIPYNRRKELLMQQYKDYNVEGIFFVHQKFCDPNEFDVPVLAAFAREKGIPNFFMELDTTIPVGQLRTRAEAFLEMLQLELV